MEERKSKHITNGNVSGEERETRAWDQEAQQ